MGVAIAFRQLFDAAPDAMVMVDHVGRVSAVNHEAEQWFGWTEAELVGEPMRRLIPSGWGDSSDSIGVPYRSRSEHSNHGATTSCFARRRNGSEFPVQLAYRPLGLSHEADSLMTLRDLTPWHQAQETRSQNNEQAHDVLASIGDAVITTDTLGHITFINSVAEQLTGWKAEEAIGEMLDVVIPLISEVGRHPIIGRVMQCLEAERSIDLKDGVLLLRRDGSEVPIGDSAAPIRDRSGAMVGVVLVIQDESEKRRVGRRLSHDASHDALTGLLNRRELDRRLAHLLTRLIATRGEHVLLCIDLDGFKAINDSFGHDAGDAMLQSLAPLLSRRLRDRDAVARLGGDEFGILLENCPLSGAERIAKKMLADLAEHQLAWGDKMLSVTASIGLTMVTLCDGGIAAVRQAGDSACYMAKREGGNRLYFQNPLHLEDARA